MAAFAGFSQKTLDFLTGLEANNTKEWFAAHKPDYQAHLLAPFVALATDLGPVMKGIDPELVTTPAVGKTLSRMHRDVRFSKDKSPYRALMWLGFKRPVEVWQHHPAFYFELTPRTHRFGMGFYCAAKPTMDRLRLVISQYPDAFRKQVAFLGESPFEVEGERYKRVQNPDLPDDLRDWCQWKSFYLVANRDNDAGLFKPEFAQVLAKAYTSAVPFYHFLSELSHVAE